MSPRGTAAQERRLHHCFRQSISALSATEAHKKQLLYQNTQCMPRQLQGNVIPSAAQEPDSPKQRHERSRNPHSFPWAVTSRSGRAKKGMFWAKFPLTQLLYLRLEGCKKRWFQLGAGSGNRKIRQAMRKAGSALLGHPVLLVSGPRGVRLAAAVDGGRDRGLWWHWVHAKGDSCCPHLAQGWQEPSSLHPILFNLTEENRILL